MPQAIHFDGAAETVTGSRHLLSLDGKRILVDCGLYQGSRELRERNSLPFQFEPRELDAVVITHAHLDHIGLLPRLVKEGYDGPIYATKATIELARISLPDSGRLQEEDAYHANKRPGEHAGVSPLYTERDAYASLKQFRPLSYHEPHPLPGGGTLRYLFAGHILGSAFAEIYFRNGERVLMSGDLGRYRTAIIRDPETVESAEYLVVESTYGDRLHPKDDPEAILESVLKEAWTNGSVVLVPSFAIGRTQELLYAISNLQRAGRAPRIPLYLDSPMATSTTSVYRQAKEELDADMAAALARHEDPLEPDGLQLVRDRNASKALNDARGPLMVIAGSGMANGGRIVHHLMHRLPDPSTMVLFTGYQGEGTLGRDIQEGRPEVRILGHEVQNRAQSRTIGSLSAHADQGEIMQWLRGFQRPPRRTFIVHGEPPAQAALKAKIEADLGWDVVIPKLGQGFDL